MRIHEMREKLAGITTEMRSIITADNDGALADCAKRRCNDRVASHDNGGGRAWHLHPVAA